MRRADERMLRVAFLVRREALVELDVIAAARGIARAELLREAVGWMIAKETAWMERRREVERYRAQLAADEAASIARVRARQRGSDGS